MNALAHDSSSPALLCAVILAAQGACFASIAGVSVTRVAISSATVPYCSASKLDTDCASASLPKPLPSSSLGSALAGLVASPSTSRKVLLSSKRVRRRSGAWPGASAPLPVHADIAGGAPGPVVPAPPFAPAAPAAVPGAVVPAAESPATGALIHDGAAPLSISPVHAASWHPSATTVAKLSALDFIDSLE
jgi:hypothetical protein